MLLKLIIKGSDISNPCRPYEIASQWNELCYAEFYGEGDVDREKGRALNPLHDRDNNSIPKSSIGFIGAPSNTTVVCLLHLYVLSFFLSLRCTLIDVP